MADKLENVSAIVTVRSNVYGRCHVCHSVEIGGDRHFDSGVNHYIRDHGYILLHVGTESSFTTVHGRDELWTSTVAVVGQPHS